MYSSAHIKYRAILQELKPNWRALVVTDLLFRAIAFIVLTPCVSALFRLFLAVSGRDLLADADIPRFFLHPTGWLAFIIVGGGFICVLALELAAQLTILHAGRNGTPIGTLSALQFVRRHFVGTFRLSLRFAGIALLIAAPFLIVSGICYMQLLTEYDINFYLAERPREFWLAVACIGPAFAVLALLELRWTVDALLALPLHLFENVLVGECFSQSKNRTIGHRRAMFRSLLIWLGVNLALSAVGTGLVSLLGRWLVSVTQHSLTALLLAVGFMLLMWWLVQFMTSLLAVLTFAGFTAAIYRQTNPTGNASLPTDTLTGIARAPLVTRFRIVSGIIVAMLLSAVIGVIAAYRVSIERDDVQITAHRGGAAKAPENTLAAFRHAIAVHADWIELDVQESKDGVVMVAHDADLMRLANNKLKIWESTAEELRQVDIGSYFDKRFSNERMPTLEEVLKLCRGKIKINIELKYYGHDQQLEERVIELVEQHEMHDQIVIMSLERKLIDNVKRLRPHWTVGLLTAVAAGKLTSVEADFLAINAHMATPKLIKSAHKKGKAVHVWTINDRLSMSAMMSRDVDNLITDDPELARAVIAERAEMSPIERLLIDTGVSVGVHIPLQEQGQSSATPENQ